MDIRWLKTRADATWQGFPNKQLAIKVTTTRCVYKRNTACLRGRWPVSSSRLSLNHRGNSPACSCSPIQIRDCTLATNYWTAASDDGVTTTTKMDALAVSSSSAELHARDRGRWHGGAPSWAGVVVHALTAVRNRVTLCRVMGEMSELEVSRSA